MTTSGDNNSINVKQSKEEMANIARAILTPFATTRTLNAVFRAYIGGFFGEPLQEISTERLSIYRGIGVGTVAEIQDCLRRRG